MGGRLSKTVMRNAIERVYQAGCDPAHWPELVHFCQRLFPGSAFSLIIHDPRRVHDPLPWSAGWNPDFERSYVEHYHKLNTYADLLRRIPPGQVATTSQVVNPEWRERQPFFHEWLKPAGNFTHGASLTLQRSGGGLTRLCYDIPTNRAHLEPATADFLGRMGPHFRRALELTWCLQGTSLLASGLQALLDRRDEPALIVDLRRRVIAANARAVALLDSQRVLREIPGAGLAFVSPDANAAFRRALAACGRADEPAPCFAVASEEGARAPVYILPLHAPSQSTPGAPMPALALVILKLAPRPRLPPPELLKALYHVSTAEAAVALRIAEGRALEAIAQDLGVSHATARNQLAAAMTKLGVHRQAELVALLAALAP